jgi:hypothetical protein
MSFIQPDSEDKNDGASSHRSLVSAKKNEILKQAEKEDDESVAKGDENEHDVVEHSGIEKDDDTPLSTSASTSSLHHPARDASSTEDNAPRPGSNNVLDKDCANLKGLLRKRLSPPPDKMLDMQIPPCLNEYSSDLEWDEWAESLMKRRRLRAMQAEAGLEDDNHAFHGMVVVCRSGPHRKLKFRVTDVCILGTDKECTVPLEHDRFVSRKHCVIRYCNGEFVLSDLQSKWGTYFAINKDQVYRLEQDDILLAGNTEFQVIPLLGREFSKDPSACCSVL